MRLHMSRGVGLTLILAHLALLVGGRKKRHQHKHYQFEDCGEDPDRPIKILNFDIRPMPVRSPGKLKIWSTVNISRTLPEAMSAHVSVAKYFLGFAVKVFCANNIGTCHYDDVCGMLDALWAGQGLPRRRCPRRLRRRGIPCRCPFGEGEYDSGVHRFPVPAFDGLLGLSILGKYDATIRIIDTKTRDELGCLAITVEIKRQKQSRMHLFVNNT